MDIPFFFFRLLRLAPFWGALTCLCILLAGLIHRDATPPVIRRVLMGLLGSIAINWLYINMAFSIETAIIPFLPLLYVCTLLVPVLFYHFIYLLTLSEKNKSFSIAHYIIPFLMFLITGIGVCFFPDSEMISIVQVNENNSEANYFPPLLQIISLIRFIATFIYSILSLIQIRQYRKEILNYSSNEERSSLKWLSMLVILSIALILVPLLAWLPELGKHREEILNPSLIIIVVLVMWQIISLTYNTLCRNFEIILPDQPHSNCNTVPEEATKSPILLTLGDRLESYITENQLYARYDL